MTNVPHLDTYLERVVHLVAAVDPPAHVGLTVRDHQPFTLVSSDPLAARLDDAQYGHDQGPCLDSVRHGIAVQVDDITRELRWHGYPAYAVAQGVLSSLSLPVDVDGQTVASLNIYSRRPAAFDGASRRHAEAFAGQCAAALALVLRLTDQTPAQQGTVMVDSGGSRAAGAYSQEAALRATQLYREATEIHRRVAAAIERAQERITRFRGRAANQENRQTAAQSQTNDSER